MRSRPGDWGRHTKDKEHTLMTAQQHPTVFARVMPCPARCRHDGVSSLVSEWRCLLQGLPFR